ncbi:PREDICTED: UBX domain-containing protein 4-like [Nicrophorus vespilloides]|uniref:UBX domain-containing protein 4 n=1 Tax=Nicrophorus vespilloides TaxID=110193 RepID=A0ABM1MPH6_NICVS|nr:PREDICTED: UBX domain-containing protein 4-like [Nicrophorus vespilloides]
MKWYEGGITEAVSLYSQNKLIFVVYIEGKDEKSVTLTKMLDDDRVSGMLENPKFITLKVEENSLPHQQFSEIYKQTPVPSIYFIGSGSTLEIVTESKDAADLAKKINEILVKGGESPIAIQTENFLQSEAAASSSNAECVGEACSIKPSEVAEPLKPEENNAALSVEEKLKLAQDLIEKKRAMKKVEEEELEKSKEIERRKMGHDVQKMKRWQQDQEIKQRMEEREKEKREEKEARDKVRRQIEEDKREKAARMSASPPAAAATVQQRRVRPNDSNSSRLQFRLPDGSSHTHDFPSSVPLQEVINFVKENLIVGFTNFVLSTTFPRREFQPEEANETLLNLELVPNAVILVLPVSRATVSTNNPNQSLSIFWQLLAPLFTIWNYMKSFLFKDPPRQSNDNNTRLASTSRPRAPKREAGESVIKRQGNVHKLSDRDSEDENNTWNGNSTQQM